MPDSKNREGAGHRHQDSPTSDQLRHDIDSGRTRDKVAHSDPAMAPLGTDDEAAGTPPTGEQVAAARQHETGRDGADPEATARPPGGPAQGSWMVWLIGGAVVLAAVTAIAFAI